MTLLADKPTKTGALSTARRRAEVCAQVADDNKGRDILLLDMSGLTPLYDFMVIVSGTSRRQIHTIAEEIDDAMRSEGDQRVGLEGYETSKWVIQDYGDVVVHLFEPAYREYYDLENLWADAPRVKWQ